MTEYCLHRYELGNIFLEPTIHARTHKFDFVTVYGGVEESARKSADGKGAGMAMRDTPAEPAPRVRGRVTLTAVRTGRSVRLPVFGPSLRPVLRLRR